MCLLVAGCRVEPQAVTLALALLPSELPPYRAVIDDFARESGISVSLVPLQYSDIRRALAAESRGGAGTLDLVELDVHLLAAAAPYVAELDRNDLAEEIAALDPAALRAGELDGLRFLPHRVSWQALIYNHAVLGEPPHTWEDLLRVARAHPGRIGWKASLSEALTCDILPFVWSAGGSGERLDDAGARQAFALFDSLAPFLHPQSAVFRE
ncbi:MAG TPA: extracellular solute-binding protein, partial [Terriglobales bacterium]|nr:extracellular solute-binding protein [Terriglobales bacterium]